MILHYGRVCFVFMYRSMFAAWEISSVCLSLCLSPVILFCILLISVLIWATRLDEHFAFWKRVTVFMLFFVVISAGLTIVPWEGAAPVCIMLHQHTSLNCAHRSLNQPIVVTSVQLLGVTLQFHAPEQRVTAKDGLLLLVQHSGIHSHCLFVIHHWHWLSSVRVWRLCYGAEHTKH